MNQSSGLAGRIPEAVPFVEASSRVLDPSTGSDTTELRAGLSKGQGERSVFVGREQYPEIKLQKESI